jgi:hypothetical protein
LASWTGTRIGYADRGDSSPFLLSTNHGFIWLKGYPDPLFDPLPRDQVIRLTSKDKQVIAEFEPSHEITHVARIDISDGA